MKLTVLGSGTCLSDPERGAPGYLLQDRDTSIVIDSGSGTLQRLGRAGLNPVTIDGLVYTHRHVDHCAARLRAGLCEQEPGGLRLRR